MVLFDSTQHEKHETFLKQGQPVTLEGHQIQMNDLHSTFEVMITAYRYDFLNRQMSRGNTMTLLKMRGCELIIQWHDWEPWIIIQCDTQNYGQLSQVSGSTAGLLNSILVNYKKSVPHTDSQFGIKQKRSLIIVSNIPYQQQARAVRLQEPEVPLPTPSSPCHERPQVGEAELPGPDPPAAASTLLVHIAS